MYKLVVYRSSRPIGYIFVEDISFGAYSAIDAEFKRAFGTSCRDYIGFLLAVL